MKRFTLIFERMADHAQPATRHTQHLLQATSICSSSAFTAMRIA
jgi:hypothetical protein